MTQHPIAHNDRWEEISNQWLISACRPYNLLKISGSDAGTIVNPITFNAIYKDDFNSEFGSPFKQLTDRNMITEYHKVEYRPDMPTPIFKDLNGTVKYNTFRSDTVMQFTEPDDMQPAEEFERYLDRAFYKQAHIVKQFLASQVQRPGRKIPFILHIYDPEGPCSRLVFDVLREILGVNYGKVTMTRMNAKYYDWCFNASLLVLDGVTFSTKNGPENLEKVKWMSYDRCKTMMRGRSRYETLTNFFNVVVLSPTPPSKRVLEHHTRFLVTSCEDVVYNREPEHINAIGWWLQNLEISDELYNLLDEDGNFGTGKPYCNHKVH